MPRPHVQALAMGLALIPMLLACPKAGRPPSPPPGAAPGAPAPAPPPSAKEVVPEEGGEATFALEEPFTSLAASKLATTSDRALRGLVFHGLTRLDGSGKVEPELAASWEMLRQGAEWIFHLRPGTTFTNGRYLEARHVAASWEKLIGDENSRYGWLLEAVQGFDELHSGEAPHAEGLVLEDGLTLHVVLTRALRDLPRRLAHPALGISAFGEDEEGAGPYQIWGAPQPQKIVLRSNPEYFRGLPHLDEIAFVRGEAARPDRIGDRLDGAVPAVGEPVASGAGTRLFSHSVPRVYLLGLNRSAQPFAPLERTKQFLAALDREALCRSAAGEGGYVPKTLVAALAPGQAAASPAAAPAPRFPAQGRLDLIVPEADRTAAALAEKLQAGILKAGGKLVVHPVKPPDLAGVLARREYHLFILPFLPSSPDLLLDYEELISWNRSIPSPLAIPLRALAAAEERAAAPASLASLDAALQEGGYLVPLASVERRFLVRRDLCGLRPDPTGMLDWTAVWRSRDPRGECR